MSEKEQLVRVKALRREWDERVDFLMHGPAHQIAEGERLAYRLDELDEAINGKKRRR